MKFLILAALTFTAAAHAQIDYSLCNDTINRIFKKDKVYPYGFIQINTQGEIEASPCGGGKVPRCELVSFNRFVPGNETYKVSQAPASSSGPWDRVSKEFKVIKESGRITKIISGEDELQISYTNSKCVATALVADLPEENLREMNFDLIACKTFYELQKKYGTKLEDCYNKDMKSLVNAGSTLVRKIGSGCQEQLKDTYKHLVSLKEDIKSRYASDKTLKRKPFVDIVPPSVFNDQVIENFICSYEEVFVSPSQKKECNSSVFEIIAPSETALGVFVSNKKTCSLIYSDETLGSEEIFKVRVRDSLVYSLNTPSSGKSGTSSGSKGSSGSAQ